MTTPPSPKDIKGALARLEDGPLLNGATNLFATLGYRSERRIDLADRSGATFAAAFDRDGRLEQHALLQYWQAVEMVFQLSAEEIRQSAQLTMNFGDQFDQQLYRSFLFFTIELRSKGDGNVYTRGELATITREINRLFTMPVSVLFRFPHATEPGARLEPHLTLAIVTHRPNRRDDSRDVLEKVSLIHAVRLGNPHRAHIEILHDLALGQLSAAFPIGGFDDLQRVWARTLDITELNRRFYKEVADWYFWAVDVVTFPEGAGDRQDVRNATSVIRLLTRLIFVWFLKEKGLVPDELFRKHDVEAILNSVEPEECSFYKAILQNLFFGTLNTPMNDPRQPRRFRAASRGSWPNEDHGIASVFRYESLFRDSGRALDLFRNVPFLNGGLFECLDPDTGRTPATLVDGFSEMTSNPLHVPNMLFYDGPTVPVDLNRIYGTRGRTFKVRGLIDILNRYKFTIAENTPVEQEVALDPELLGQVFENLLAAYNPETETTARKETGSFYTPRGVVEYMVDESLLLVFGEKLTATGTAAQDGDGASLDDRLRQLLTYNHLTARELFSEHEIVQLIETIDNLKMIDPACGSGAFPMGALQKLVYVLSKLDPGNQRWRGRQEERAEQIPDPEARDAALTAIQEAFERNELDYGRKLYLIENCIYGVDILPIAVQICKLRCFISLVVDQRVDRANPDNLGIRALPNLETRFVIGDAIRRVPRGKEAGPGIDLLQQQLEQMSLRDPEVDRLERALNTVRSRYFSAHRRAEKKRYREQDQELRAQLADALSRTVLDVNAARMLAAWDPYSQNQRAEFFDPEWMFGLTSGFDVVIANPPYVRQEQIKERKRDLAQQYESYTGTADLYVYFYERAFQLLREGGVLAFISSNKYFRAGYGQKLRRLLADRMTIAQVIDFGDAPVFTAIAYPSIIIARKGKPREDQELLALNWNPTARVGEFAEIVTAARQSVTARAPAAPIIRQKALTADGWRLEGRVTQRLLEKLRRSGRPLGEYVNGRFYYGIKTGLNEAFVVDQPTRDRLIAEHPSSAELLKPFLRGRDVKRWRVAYAGQHLIKIESSENKQHPWSGKNDTEAEQVFQRTYPAIYNWFYSMRTALIERSDQGAYFWELRSCAYWSEFQKPKVLYPDIYEHQSFTFSTEEYYSGNTTYFIPTSERWLTGLLNSLTVEWFYSQTSNRIRGGYLRAFSDYMRQIPIASSSNTTAIDRLVEEILAAKADDTRANVSAQEREIDERVYALYGLRPDEIRTIEESVQGGRTGGTA